MHKSSKLIQSGIGLFMTGSNGVGKTYVLSMMLKDFVCTGYPSFFITADDLFAMKTDGWSDPVEKARFNKKVKNSRLLVVDDIGKEFGNRLTKQVFESLIRYRVQNSLTTFVSSNKTLDELGDEYGRSFRSLLDESFILENVEADDVRPTALTERVKEAELGWSRPIM